MTYTVSITSQGQISIPAPLRRKLGLDKHRKALVTEKGGQLMIKPIKDLLELRGSLKTNKKPLDPKKMRELFGEYLAEHATRDLK